MAKHESKSTTDHKKIKKWVEERDGKPAVVKDTKDSGKGGGLLRINFPGGAEDSLESIECDDLFQFLMKAILKLQPKFVG